MVGYPALENLRKNGALRQFSAKATIPYFDPAAVETASFLGTLQSTTHAFFLGFAGMFIELARS